MQVNFTWNSSWERISFKDLPVPETTQGWWGAGQLPDYRLKRAEFCIGVEGFPAQDLTSSTLVVGLRQKSTFLWYHNWTNVACNTSHISGFSLDSSSWILKPLVNIIHYKNAARWSDMESPQQNNSQRQRAVSAIALKIFRTYMKCWELQMLL